MANKAPSNAIRKSWSAFDRNSARRYLKGFGLGSHASKLVLAEILKRESHGNQITLLELGCGNGQLYETLQQTGLDCTYTGVDFSPVLLRAAREAFATNDKVTFIEDEITELKKVTGKYDFGIYSHVIEMLSSPERSLYQAKLRCEKIIIRFFEPPEFEWDSVELLEMPVGPKRTAPYLRRKMSRSYYQLILSKIACKKVDIYRSADKDQIHVLHF
jgi:ubiquinone/menaquinone biosynthesis C-methylase UbiE